LRAEYQAQQQQSAGRLQFAKLRSPEDPDPQPQEA